MKNKDAVNIAIIGGEGEESRLLPALSECQSINIIGFCNPNPDSASMSFIQELNIPLFDKIEQLPAIGEVDLIIDASEEEISVREVKGLERVEIIRGKSADIIKRLAEREKHFSEDVSGIFDVGIELTAQKDSKSIYRKIMEGALKVTGCTLGTLMIFNERTEILRLADMAGYSKTIDNPAWELQPGGIMEQLLDREEPLFVYDINEEPLFDNPVMNEGTVSVLATALKEADEVIGLLFVGDFSRRKFSERQLRLFSGYAVQASLALQKALLIEKNEELTVTDPLTGVNNKSHFFTMLDAEIQRTDRYGGHFSVLLMDLDNLSYINDYFGHEKGDWALKKVTEAMHACSRQTDYKARYSGDQFVMILPSTDCAQASVVANRIKREVNDVVVEAGIEDARLSLSIGIAQFPCLGTNCDDLMTAVSTALFICKQRGRNLVCCYDDAGGAS